MNLTQGGTLGEYDFEVNIISVIKCVNDGTRRIIKEKNDQSYYE